MSPTIDTNYRKRCVHLQVELPEDLPIGALRELLELHGIRTLDVSQTDPRSSAAVRRLDIVAPLTPTERIVITALTFCDTTEVVAKRLSVSETTIKTHVRSILRKLRVGSRTAAVGRALRLGIISVVDLDPNNLK